MVLGISFLSLILRLALHACRFILWFLYAKFCRSNNAQIGKNELQRSFCATLEHYCARRWINVIVDLASTINYYLSNFLNGVIRILWNYFLFELRQMPFRQRKMQLFLKLETIFLYSFHRIYKRTGSTVNLIA